MKKALIVAFALGVPKSIPPNEFIGEISSAKAREMDGSVYTQADVPVAPGVEVIFTREKLGDPPPTLRIARGAVDYAKQEEVKEFWVVAARPHIWRCMRDLKFAAREAGVQLEIRVCDEIYQYPRNKWYCSDSTQLRTRSRMKFWPRELTLRIMPMFLYKRIAG